MKVIHIRWSLNFGGLETMLVNISNEQARQGIEVSVIIINDVIAEDLYRQFAKNVRVIRLGRPAHSKSLVFEEKLRSVINELHPDIIHLHDASLFDFLPRDWVKNSKKVCVTLHSMPYGNLGINLRVGRLIQNLIFHKGGNVMNTNRVGKVFSISNAVATALKERYNVESTVICNGIHTDLFKRRNPVGHDKEMRIVQVGRLNHHSKGQDLLIEGVKKVIKHGYLCHLTIIGDGVSRNYLEDLVSRLDLQQSVVFLGSQTQEYLMQHLCEYDLFVQPSRREGFGLTVAEAMAASLPVLVSSGQGPAEVTENNRFGWVFNNEDTEDLASKIEFIYNHYDECINKVQAALQHVIENFDVKNTASRYISSYHEMMTN